MHHYCIFFRFSVLFMQKGLLLPGERVTTFRQKGYYIWAKGLRRSENVLICIWFWVISVLFREHFILK